MLSGRGSTFAESLWSLDLKAPQLPFLLHSLIRCHYQRSLIGSRTLMPREDKIPQEAYRTKAPSFQGYRHRRIGDYSVPSQNKTYRIMPR